MRKKKIFLASSNELKEERQSFAKFIREINEVMKLHDIELEAEQWEFKDKAIRGYRIQDMYNETLANCEICIVLFWTKRGKYTQEELDFAYNKFMEGLNPRKIFVFFKNDNSKKISNGLIKFKKNFPNRYKENFPFDYSNIDELRFNLLLQITMYFGNDAVTLIFNNHLIDCTKLPCFIGNKENSEVLESYKKASLNCEKYPDDNSFKKERSMCETKLNAILTACITTAKMTGNFDFNGNNVAQKEEKKALIHYYQQCQNDEMRRIIEKTNNPFIVSGTFKNEFLCDRIKTGENIEKLLLNGDNIFLVAPRNSGKTTFIKNRLQNSLNLKKSHYFIYCDLFTMNSLKDFAFVFIKRIIEDVTRILANKRKSFANNLKYLSSYIDFNTNTGNFVLSITKPEDIVNPFEIVDLCFDFLEELEKPCIVCFDDFQSVRNDKSGRIEGLIYENTKKLNNVRFVFVECSHYYLELATHSIHHSIIENSTIFILDPIKREDYLLFAQYWFNAYSKRISASAFSLVYDFCHGSPCYIQKVLHKLFIEIESGKTCQQENVLIAIDSLTKESALWFQQQLSHFSRIEQLILYYLSEEGFVEDIIAFAMKYDPLKQRRSTISYLFNRLVSNDWIRHHDNKYYVEDVFLCHFLKTYWPTIQPVSMY